MKQDWEIKKLSEIGKVFNGNSINEKVKKDKYTGLDDGLPFIATKDVGFDSEIDYENGVRIPFNEINQFKIAPSNTPLICAEGGSAGRKIGFTNQDVCFGNKLFALVSNKNVDSKYVYYYYFTSSFQKHFSTEMAGIIGGVSMNKFKDIEIPLPPLPEQQRIVSILDEAFAAIAKAKANAEQNLKNAKELFESYLQGVFEKKGDGWEERKVKDIGFAQTGTTPKTAEKENYGDFIPFIKPADVDFTGIGDIRYDNEGLSEIGLKKGRKMESGSILMVCIGATIGKVGFAEREVSCNQQINSLTVKKEFEPKFIYYAMTSKEFQEKVLLEGKGAQATLPIINKSKWENLTISFPKSKIEQQTIVRQLDALRAETQKLEAVYQKKIADLEELKKSILQKAFSGGLNLDFKDSQITTIKEKSKNQVNQVNQGSRQ